MGDSIRSWNWEVPAFEASRGSSAAAAVAAASEIDDAAGFTTLHVSASIGGRRLSLPSQFASSSCEEQHRKQEIANKASRLREALQETRLEFLELRQEASDLQEYSSAKLDRVTRYLGVLSDKTRKLDQITLDYEARLAFLRKEKRLLFNELVSAKGNIRVFLRARPHSGGGSSTLLSFPDDNTVLINNPADPRTGNIEFRFDHVYGSHVSQGELFQDIQPLVQSALDGYNVSIFACGPKGSGKTYTLEGPNHDRGVYFRTFEELFDLSIDESTPTLKFVFYVTIFEISNEINDFLKDIPIDPMKPASVIEMESTGPLVRHRVENPTDFARVFKAGLQSQHSRPRSFSSPYLVVTFHIHCSNSSTGEDQYSKISLVDVPGSEQTMSFDGISAAFSSLLKVLSAVSSKREVVPYKDSKAAQILADCIGGESKTLIILNIDPSDSVIDETKCWLKTAKVNDTSRTLQNKIYEEQNREMKLELERLRKSLNESENLCKELQKSSKAPNADAMERSKFERDQIVQLKTQVVQYARSDREQKAELANRASKILSLEDKLQELSQLITEKKSKLGRAPSAKWDQDQDQPSSETAFEEEISKRDELIERLHEENEKLFQRLTSSPKVHRPDNLDFSGSFKKPIVKRTSPYNRTGGSDPGFTTALQKAGTLKTTPAGDYLTTALSTFDPDEYSDAAAVSDAANKLLMLVLAAVIKAGATREHDMLEEIRDAVFAFIRKLEPRKLMDTLLVSRVRILYVRSLVAKSTELQNLKVPSVDKFLEKVGVKSSRTSSNGSSPTRSPASFHSNIRKDIMDDDRITAFTVNIKQEKASKLSSIVLKLRGIDQETWRQHITAAKLREIYEDARNFAVGNKRLASLFVHTPAGDLHSHIRAWLADNFEYLSVTSGDSVSGSVGQVDLLATAIMDGWMAGLGIPTRPSTDALGQLLSDYTKHVYLSQLQHLKDVAGTLATEEVDDLAQLTKIRSSLEAIDSKRRKIMQQMRTDAALLTKEEGGSPARCPSTASEEARIASLISLEDIINQAEEIRKEASQKATRKAFMLSRLNSLSEQTSALLSIDHTCAQKFIKEAQQAIEVAEKQHQHQQQQLQQQQQQMLMSRKSRKRNSDEVSAGDLSSSSGDWGENSAQVAANEVVQWSVLQFNNGAETPFIIKCGATSMMQLVIKAQATHSGESSSSGVKEIVAIVPSPSALSGLTLEEIKKVLAPLPQSFSQLAMARTADNTRARYSRLYKTLAVRVPSLRNTVSDAEYDSAGGGAANKAPASHVRRASDSDRFSSDYY